jgi:valyl-tRNA synthetase
VLEKSLRMLHPVMPFITEDIWQRLPREHGTDSVMISKWPHMQKTFVSKKIDSEMSILIDVIQTIRNLRATWNVEHKREIDIFIKAKKKNVLSGLKGNTTYIKKLARVGGLEISDKIKKPPHSAVSVVGDTEIFIPLEGVIDIEKEKSRLGEKLAGLEGELKRAEARLKNKNFASKAPAAVVRKTKERVESIKAETKPLKKNLKSL